MTRPDWTPEALAARGVTCFVSYSKGYEEGLAQGAGDRAALRRQFEEQAQDLQDARAELDACREVNREH